MKVLCYVLIVFLLFTSCFSYRKTVSNTSEITLRKHYKFKFYDGSVQRKKITNPIDSLTVKHFFKKPGTFAIKDAVEIKEGKFSVLKTAGFAFVWTIVTNTVLTVIALASFDLNLGDGNIQAPN